jgi:ABC-type transport system involved in multi-copper enzyme maturation permease subunit
MKYLAILKDSLLETIDQKLLYVMMGFSLVVVLVCGIVSFPRQPVDQVLQRNIGSRFKVSNVEAIDANPFSSKIRYRCEIEAGEVTGLPTFPPRPGPPGMRPPGFGDGLSPVAGLTSIFGFKDTKLTETAKTNDGKLERGVVETTINWPEVLQGHKISILFGLIERDMPLPLGGIITGVQIFLVDYIAGVGGVILAVIITAGFVPNMMRKGSIDLLLVKPISRPLLLLYKYLGGLLFVLFNAVVLVGSSWVIFGFTIGNWNTWYLASIGVLLFYFAVVYSFSVLIGVLTQSQLAAILLTLAFYLFLIILNMLYGWTQDARSAAFVPQELITAVDWVHFVMPRLGDLSALNLYALAEANGLPDAIGEERRQSALKFSWTETLVTSGAFILVMLTLSCWRFSRRDY